MWSKTLLEASFRGVKFDCLSINDSFDKATAEHAFPYLPGADVEDMGRGPRHVSVEAFFYGDDYEDRLKAFIAGLEKPGAGELVHPVFGSMQAAQVLRVTVHHEAENIDQATLSFELSESTAGNPFFTQQTAGQQADAVNQQAQAARDASALTLSNVMARLKALNPMSQLTALRQQLLGPVFALKAIAGGVLSAGMDMINYPLSWAGDLTALSGGVMNVGGFSTTTLLADYRNAVTRLAGVLFTGSAVINSGTGVQGVSPAVVRIDPVTPTEAGAIQAAQVHVQVERAATIADTAAAVLQSEIVAPTLAPADIESVCSGARSELELTIELVRAAYPVETAHTIIESLKDTALALQAAAQAVIVVRPPLIARPVVSPAPLRVLAHRWYGDHNRALELQRLNGLANPNFLQATDTVNAYAS